MNQKHNEYYAFIQHINILLKLYEIITIIKQQETILLNIFHHNVIRAC